jgi:prefoldin subunit 5
MTDDLVKRLRDNMNNVDAYESHISNAISEAADRIEQLEAALREIAEGEVSSRMFWATDVARAALEGKDE